MTESSESTNHSYRNIVKNILGMYGHAYALILILFAAVYTRIQGFEFIRNENGEIIFLDGNGWMHYRATEYTVENWPAIFDVDPLSGYPTGSNFGYFGSFYDLLIGTIALIIGLGSPSDDLIRTILALSSPILSFLTIYIVYLFTRYITGSEWMGVLSAFILTFIPSVFYFTGVIGFSSHQILEAFLLISTLFATMKALETAEKESISINLIKQKEYEIIKPWVTRTVIAGSLLTLYYFTWAPAIFLFVLLSVSTVLYSVVTYGKPIPTEPSSITIASILSFAVIGTIVQNPTTEITIATVSIIHVFITFTSLSLVLFTLILKRKAFENNWSRGKFTISVTTFIGGLIAVSMVILPSVSTEILDHIIRLLGFGSPYESTIVTQSPDSLFGLAFTQYGFTIVTAIVGVLFLIFDVYNKHVRSMNYIRTLSLVIISSFILIVGIRTSLVDYYLSPFVAILSSLLVYRVIKFTDVPRNVGDIKGYQLITVIILVFIFVPVLLIPVGGSSSVVYNSGAGDFQSQSYNEVNEPLEWLSGNSPGVGFEKLESSSEYPVEYTEESYGVISSSGNGHLITNIGERPSVATSHGQHQSPVSDYLLATDENEAESYINELREDVESDSRYVLIDWRMIDENGGFSNLVDQSGGDIEDYTNTFITLTQDGPRFAFTQRQQSYYETMVSRLYHAHGSHMDSSDIAIEFSTETTEGGDTVRTVSEFENPIKQFNTSEEASSFAEENSEVELGGVGINPPEEIEALDSYRLVKSNSLPMFDNPRAAQTIAMFEGFDEDPLRIGDFSSNPASSKLFERVPGADIEGENAPANERIEFNVVMNDPAIGVQFSYSQYVETDNSGDFNITLPYSTTGYDENQYAPEVQAVDQYRILDNDGSVLDEIEIPEEDVISEDTVIELTL